MYEVYRGKNVLGRILGFASNPEKTREAAIRKFGAGVGVRRA